MVSKQSCPKASERDVKVGRGERSRSGQQSTILSRDTPRDRSQSSDSKNYFLSRLSMVDLVWDLGSLVAWTCQGQRASV
jgi:hypothetical protein